MNIDKENFNTFDFINENNSLFKSFCDYYKIKIFSNIGISSSLTDSVKLEKPDYEDREGKSIEECGKELVNKSNPLNDKSEDIPNTLISTKGNINIITETNVADKALISNEENKQRDLINKKNESEKTLNSIESLSFDNAEDNLASKFETETEKKTGEEAFPDQKLKTLKNEQQSGFNEVKINQEKEKLEKSEDEFVKPGNASLAKFYSIFNRKSMFLFLGMASGLGFYYLLKQKGK